MHASLPVPCCRLANMGSVPLFVHNLLSMGTLEQWPTWISTAQLMQDANTFFQANGMGKVASNVLIMQIRAWSPYGMFTPHRKSPTASSRQKGYTVPPLAAWRSFFQEKLQVRQLKPCIAGPVLCLHGHIQPQILGMHCMCCCAFAIVPPCMVNWHTVIGPHSIGTKAVVGM